MFDQSTPIKQILADYKITKGLKSTPTSEPYTFQSLRVILSFNAAKAVKYFTHPQN